MENELIYLDTSVLIDFFRKTKKENSFFYNLTNDYSQFAVSVITEFEIYCGVKPEQRSFWDNLFSQFQILPFDSRANKEAVQIYQALKRKSKLIEMPDILIRATAKAYGLKLATINTKHFDRIEGLALISI